MNVLIPYACIKSLLGLCLQWKPFEIDAMVLKMKSKMENPVCDGLTRGNEKAQ